MAKSMYMNDSTKPEVIDLISKLAAERRLSLLKMAEILLLEAGSVLKNHPEEYRNFIKQFEKEKTFSVSGAD